MGWNMSNILVNEAIANKKSGGGSELDSRVAALETTVGDETSGLVKEVDDLETTVSTLNYYSTDEIKIGKWGAEDLYRKVITGNMPDNAEIGFDTGLSNVKIRYLYGTSENDIGFGTIPYPMEGALDGTVRAYYKKSDNKVYISTSEATTGTFEIVLEYTKNPENNTRKRGK